MVKKRTTKAQGWNVTQNGNWTVSTKVSHGVYKKKKDGRREAYLLLCSFFCRNFRCPSVSLSLTVLCILCLFVRWFFVCIVKSCVCVFCFCPWKYGTVDVFGHRTTQDQRYEFSS